MCTGAEIAAAAAAAAESGAVGGGAAATAAGAGAAGGASALGAASAGSLGALGSGAAALESGGLGALLASGGAEAAGTAGAEAAAAAAGSAAAESGAAGATLAAAEAAPTTVAAAEAAPATVTAAETAPTTLSAAESAAATPGISPAPGASQSLSQGLGSQMGQSLDPALFNGSAGAGVTQPASSTFLGMTPTQWTQQLVAQGGAAGLQSLGAAQSQSAQRDVSDSYNQALSEWEKAQLAAVDEGMAGYTPEAIAANQKRYKDEMTAAYDENLPKQSSFGATLLASTPDEVKADYAAKQAATNDYARNQYLKSLDLTSVGRALTSGAQQLQDALTRAGMNKSVINSYMSGLSGSMSNASQSGALASGLGNLTSSLGNALLASQQSSGTIK